MSSTLNIHPAAITLLAKLLAGQAKVVREELTIGEHTVEETVTLGISGVLSVGKDYEQRIVAKADPWALFAIALRKLNMLTDVDGIKDLVIEAGQLTKAESKAVKDRVSKVMVEVKDPTITACKGKVTVAKTATVTTK